MVLPVFGSAGTYLAGGSATSAAIPVPAGVAAGHFIMVCLYKEFPANVVTPPDATWRELIPIRQTTAATVHAGHIFWKRATGADTGTYTFTWTTGAVWRSGVAVRFTGVVAVGATPFNFVNSAVDSGAPTVSPAVSGTTTLTDCLLVWFCASFSTNAFTPPTNFTERVDATTDNCSVATRDWSAPAASGAVTGTTAAGAKVAWLVALASVTVPHPPKRPMPRLQAAQRAANW